MIDSTLRQLAENAEQPVVVTDAAGRVRWINDPFVAMCGHAPAELVGRKPGDVLQGPDTCREAVRAISEAVRDGRPFIGEILNYHADGHAYWVHLNIVPIRDADDRLHAFIAFELEIPYPGRDAAVQPICMYCRRMHDIDGDWIALEEFYLRRMRARLSHGICPRCVSSESP